MSVSEKLNAIENEVALEENLIMQIGRAMNGKGTTGGGGNSLEILADVLLEEETNSVTVTIPNAQWTELFSKAKSIFIGCYLKATKDASFTAQGNLVAKFRSNYNDWMSVANGTANLVSVANSFDRFHCMKLFFSDEMDVINEENTPTSNGTNRYGYGFCRTQTNQFNFTNVVRVEKCITGFRLNKSDLDIMFSTSTMFGVGSHFYACVEY